MCYAITGRTGRKHGDNGRRRLTDYSSEPLAILGKDQTKQIKSSVVQAES